ncbi:carnosine N-methyltransferase [Anthonomus grandis grandis]|uniref:carnosine N-methyltransferase n=1 Tax=Anthonomus grandis grandis TaxID=2921223 RepID=UPI0021665A16|nr:carnosine N-methyltransferase [Anthonomus grandis grandis]
METDQKIQEERAYFLRVINTFKSYQELSRKRIQHKEKCVGSLPNQHKKWLNKYYEDLQKLKEGVDKNAEFIPMVLKHACSMFDNVYCNTEMPQSEQQLGVLNEGLEKVQSVFKQLMRDWSSLGAAERKQCYDPIIQEILVHFPEEHYDRAEVQVLVPGAGLGRLAFEIASRGFKCQGNEFNLFMLIVSFYVLNLCKNVDEYLIYPWIHQYCNNHSVDDQLTTAKFPDVKPMPSAEGNFSMTAGDFLEVYTMKEEWDCVATCFFIDCAPNVVQFIETIYEILKPGGVWINLGPLLYHYSDVKKEKSIEPSFKVVCDVIKKVGFQMEKCETGVKTKYCQNPNSMLQYEYDSVFFVCRKADSINGQVNGEFNT